MTSMDGYILSRGVQRNSTHHWVGHLHQSHPGQQQKVLGCDDGLLPITSSTLAAVKDFFRKSYPPPNYVSLHLFQLHPEEDASQLLPLTTSSTSWTPSASTSSAWLEKPPPRMSWMGSMGWGTRSCLMSMLLSQGGGKLTLSSTCTAPS